VNVALRSGWQPLAGVGVPAVGDDDEGVPLGEVRQRQALLLAVRAHVELDAVQRRRVQPLGDQVDERVRAGAAAGELHRRRGAEGLRARVPGTVGDVELEVVALHRQQVGAGSGFGAGEVG
jgi:hypothetical protein